MLANMQTSCLLLNCIQVYVLMLINYIYLISNPTFQAVSEAFLILMLVLEQR